MAVKTLTDQEKDEIVALYAEDATIKSLAEKFSVSPRTIGRVLQEKDVLTPHIKISERDAAFLAMLKKYSVQTPEQLENIFNTPALVLPNILDYLKEATPSELAFLFFEAAMVKVKEQAAKQQQIQSKEGTNAHNIH